MKALLDTHTLLWWLDGDEQLSVAARDWIGEASHSVLASAASAWEIATKVRIGKLPGRWKWQHGIMSASWRKVLHRWTFLPIMPYAPALYPDPTATLSTAC